MKSSLRDDILITAAGIVIVITIAYCWIVNFHNTQELNKAKADYFRRSQHNIALELIND